MNKHERHGTDTTWNAVTLIGLGTILALFVAHVVYLNCVVEDAYITFRYARNLTTGLGLVWNAGERPVEGYTNLLWVLVSAAAMRLNLDVPRFAQIAGTLCGAATIVLTYAAGRRLAAWPRPLAIVPALMLAVSGPFATWAGSGMETVLFGSLVLTGVVAFASYWQGGGLRWLVFMSLALLAAALTRPEGAMVFALLMGASLALSVGEFRRRMTDHAVSALCWGVPFALYFVWRYSYFGYLLPNTFYAKTTGGLDQILRGALTTAQFAWQFLGPLLPWALVAFWETGIPRVGPLRAAEAVARLRRHALIVACVIVSLVYTLYIVAVGNDYMAMHRFFVPVLPLIYLAASAPLALLLPRMATDGSRIAAVVTLVVLAATATLFHSTPLERHFVAESRYQHGNYEGVQTARWHVSRLSLIGRFFSEHRRSQEESLATNAIGVIGYLADFSVLDFHGLVDVHIARAPIQQHQRSALTGHQREDYPYLLAKKPTYIMFGRELTRNPDDIERFAPPEAWRLAQRDYVVRSVWLDDTVNHQAGYFTFMERRDRQ